MPRRVRGGTAREALATAETQDERQRTLLRTGVVAQATADDSALKLQQAKGALAQAEQALAGTRPRWPAIPTSPPTGTRWCCRRSPSWRRRSSTSQHAELRAPADGVVSQTDRLQQGQYVMPGGSRCSLVESDDSWIEANFKETDLSHMKAGQPVTISLDAYPGEALTARSPRSAPGPARSSRSCRRRTRPATG